MTQGHWHNYMFLNKIFTQNILYIHYMLMKFYHEMNIVTLQTLKNKKVLKFMSQVRKRL